MASQAQPQVQDQWGRSPGDPQYGQPPAQGAPGTPGNGPNIDWGAGQTPAFVPQPAAFDANTNRAPNSGSDDGGDQGDQGAPPASPSEPPQGTTPPPTPTTPTPAPTSPTSITFDTSKQGDRAYLRQWVIDVANAAHQPQAAQDADYYVGRMLQTARNGQVDSEYWKGRIENNGGTAGSPGGGPEPSNSTMAQSLYGQVPSAPVAPNGGGGIHSPTWDTKSDQLYQMLLSHAQQSLQVNPHDPIIANQMNAVQQQQQDARQNYLRELAESAGPYANIGAERRSSAETVGKNTSAMESTLMQQELTARRNEIAQALTSMQAFLTDEQKMELEAQLAEMDNALHYAQLNQQNNQFNASLSQQAYQFDTTNNNNVLYGGS